MPYLNYYTMLRKLLLTAALLLSFATLSEARQRVEGGDLTLWYKAPASNWNEALPIGNGRLGAMIFGDADNELLQLNENTLYSGDPESRWNGVDITESYPEMVALLEKGSYMEAAELLKQWTGRLHECYQPLGDWHIRDYRGGKAKAYRRYLDIANSIATVQYERDDYKFRREIFASHPDGVIVMRLTTDCPVGWDVGIALSSPHPVEVGIDDRKGILSLSGRAPGRVDRRNYSDFEAWGHEARHPYIFNADGSRSGKPRVLYGEDIDNRGMFFEGRLEVRVANKKAVTNLGDRLRIRGEKEILLIFSAATSYNGPFKNPATEGKDAVKLAEDALKRVRTKSYERLKADHIADYKALFDRMTLTLPQDKEAEQLPTDLRIRRYAQQFRTTGAPTDQQLVTLLFQYGRYLMISGSREGGQPLNLQGIWNEKIIPSWNCGYTANINVEMNYWPAEVANLSECHKPFIEMIKECAETGRTTARDMYHRRGWVGHHNCSIWRETGPNDGGAATVFWPMMGAWFSTHLWEHYAYTGDKEYLAQEAYPVMKGASEFFLDWLIRDKEGRWITPVSTSPENLFLIPGTNDACGVSQGSTGDMSMIRELFNRTAEAAEIAGIDAPFADTLRRRVAEMLPFQVGAFGRLQEWNIDFMDQDIHHRHITHLVSLYPFGQITPQSPELFAAARKTLEIRGDEATGWSSGWKINLWARLLDGERAYKLIGTLLRPVDFGGEGERSSGGGVYMNLFDAHPPFQIDGNFGMTAGVCEMLMQSHEGKIRLMPAMPAAWREGSVTGLKARGGYTIDMRWKDGRITELKIHSATGKRCEVVSTWQLPEGDYFE